MVAGGFLALVSAALASGDQSALEKRAADLRAILPEGYTVLVEGPWVVVGDEPTDLVTSRAQATVRWASSALERELFPRAPGEVWTIWMFADRGSYLKGAVDLLGHAVPDTPYGYASDGQLVINIATGSGTLIHEMVHPYVHANAPSAPPWINEGLGSLYERCTERDGHIVGLTNWRLRDLKAAIAAERLSAFETLLSLDRRTFYGRDAATNYSQARHLMLWLQEHGMLQPFFAGWLRDRAIDPTGEKTLLRLIGVDRLAEFKPDFEAWVSTLSLPEG